MKKKLLYLTSILLFTAASINAQTTRTWVFPAGVTTATAETPFLSPGSAFLTTTVVSGLTLVPGPDVTTFGVCDASNQTNTAFTDATTFTGRIKLGGFGIAATPPLAVADFLSPTANFMPNQRYVSFPVATGTTTVKVWFKTSSNGTAKSMICTNGVDWKAYVTTVGSTPGPAVDTAILTANYTASAAGTLYLFSDISVNIYKIEVTGPAVTLANNNFQKASDVTIYAKDGKINLSNVKSTTSVSVYNVLGALVKSLQTDGNTSLDINKGIYIVNAKSAQGERSVKVIVQ